MPWNFERIHNVVAYLKDLGVNAVEIMPLSNVASSVDWGYLPIGYFGVDERFGKRSVCGFLGCDRLEGAGSDRTAFCSRFLLAFLGMELRLAGHPSAIAPASDIVRATFAPAFALGGCLHAHFSHAAMERSWLFSMTY
jgi:hypothetical protein